MSDLVKKISVVSFILFTVTSLAGFFVFIPPVHAAPTISNFTADITSFPFGGGTVKFTWSAQGVVKCGSLGAQNDFFTPVGNGGNGDGGGSFDLVISTTATIHLWCADSNNVFVESQYITITVAEFSSAPNFTELSADVPWLPVGGGTFILTWKVTGATTCAVAGGDVFWASPLGGSSQRTIAQTTTYTMTCSNAAGDSVKSVTVNVESAAPIVNISATPNPLPPGQ